MLYDKEKIGNKKFSFFILINKRYKPLLDTNQFNTDSKKFILSTLIASSLSEIILLSLNINNIKKDRFLENAISNLLFNN